MKRLLVTLVLAVLSVGCGAPRLLYAGSVMLRSDAPYRFVLDGPNNRPVECQPERTDSFPDVREGQWVVVEGSTFPDNELTLRLRDCRVLASVTGESASGPGVALHRCEPRSQPHDQGEAATVPSK